ncbi:MAG TPA: hypothetical protein VFY22_02745 [Hydrogenophaga sp.]|nr:hypothetical protein [Hydrogenophaga sp.]
MRSKTLELLYAYDAQVQIVHLEQPMPELLQRNQQRDPTFRNAKLLKMLAGKRHCPPRHAKWCAGTTRRRRAASGPTGAGARCRAAKTERYTSGQTVGCQVQAGFGAADAAHQADALQHLGQL